MLSPASAGDASGEAGGSRNLRARPKPPLAECEGLAGALPAFRQGFVGLEGADVLLLAVSGGPDSMALLLMAVEWTRSLGEGAPVLHVATVDHGLRLASQDEAHFVATAAATNGLAHTTLAWTVAKPTSGLQAKARAARYLLLSDHARAIGARYILTAHHADDQAETVLLRLGRGSGLTGLAGMKPLTPLAPDLWLARPLLAFGKAELIRFCRAASCDFCDDPSNRDPHYARARIRAKAQALDELGLDRVALARFARRMARADAALEAEVDRVEEIVSPTREAACVRLHLADATALAAEIRLRLLRRAIDRVVPDGLIRLDRLEKLTEALWSALAAGRPHKATLAGTCLSLDGHKVLRIWAEQGRRRGLSHRAAKAESTHRLSCPAGSLGKGGGEAYIVHTESPMDCTTKGMIVG